jgi:hypothetical protein
MTDSRLSKAVVVYIWGEPRRLPYPSTHPQDVAKAFGDEAVNMVPYVDALLSEAYAEPMQLFGETLAESGKRIEAAIGARHPELDRAALKAIGDHFTFNTK